MVLAPLSARFQSLPPLPTIKLGPTGADSGVGGWACACSRPLWVSPRNSPVRLGLSPAAASTPTGVFNQRFEALFPLCWSPGLCGLLCSPASPPGSSMRECGAMGSAPHHFVASACCSLACPIYNPPPHWVCQPPPCCESSLPGCPLLPLLPVWMNVSSLSPWLLDFHTVRFSVCCGYFLFLNCCCPSFGCVRRCSVSTYASFLAGSP